jgi:hypothetical protein
MAQKCKASQSDNEKKSLARKVKILAGYVTWWYMCVYKKPMYLDVNERNYAEI